MHNGLDLYDNSEGGKKGSYCAFQFIELISRLVIWIYGSIAISIGLKDVTWGLLRFECVNVLHVQINVEGLFFEEPFLVYTQVKKVGWF